MTILLDGPMGTELSRRGCDTTLPLWSARALIQHPDVVFDIHRDYINAGADIITTNSFRTQPYTFHKADLRDKSRELTIKAVELARKAVQRTDVRIAGSIAPIEDCYSPHLMLDDETLFQNYTVLIPLLVEQGVDVLLIETMNSVHEAEIALIVAKEYKLPIWLSFTCDDSGTILAGDQWKKFDGIDLLMVNCSSLKGTSAAIEKLSHLGQPWGAYPNFGTVDPIKGWSQGLVSDDFEDQLTNWISRDPSLIGTCCGAIPETTRLLRNLLG